MENEVINEYTKLVWTAIPDKLGTKKQELCQRFLRKCPTPLAIKRLSRVESEEQESVCIACTDIHNEIIDWKILFVGGGCECILYPDKIFQYALRCSAQGIIMIHNHPTGAIHPSKQDESFTRRLERGCEIIGLHLVDFMIVGRDTYHSWREVSLVNELKK